MSPMEAWTQAGVDLLVRDFDKFRTDLDRAGQHVDKFTSAIEKDAKELDKLGKDAEKADQRFTKFTAYKTGRIYNNNLRMGPGGGNNYYESGPANPHKVLADLIKIFHPELLLDHELYYYKKLD